MPERITDQIKNDIKEIWDEGWLGKISNIAMNKEMTQAERNRELLKWGLIGVVAFGCVTPSVATAITPEAPGGGPNTNSTEVVPSSEVDQVFSGNFDWRRDQSVIDQVSAGTGLPQESVGNYSIVIDRSNVSTAMGNLEVKFGTSTGPDVDSTGKSVVRDYLFSTEFDGGVVQLWRSTYDVEGETWVREGFYNADGTSRTLQEYPADASAKLAAGESVKMLFYPTEAIKLQLPGVSDKPLEIQVNPKPADIPLVAATPFSDQFVSYEIPTPATKTPEPTNTALPTTTPENTPTPEVSYNCPISPDAPNMSRVSLKEDIQSGKLAQWVMKQTDKVNQRMSINPHELDYHINFLENPDIHILGAYGKDPGYSAEHSQFFGMCKINPSEFGYEGKNDIFILITILQDKNDTRMVQFTFAPHQMTQNLNLASWFTDPRDGIEPGDSNSSYADGDFILKGAQPGGPDDLRIMEKGEQFFANQGTSIEKVNEVFNEIASTDTFSDATKDFFNKTVFFAFTTTTFRP